MQIKTSKTNRNIFNFLVLKVVATSRKLWLELGAIKLELRIFLFHLKILPGSKLIGILVGCLFYKNPRISEIGFKPKSDQNSYPLIL